MENKGSTIVRDVLILAALIALVSYAIRNTSSYISLQTNSLIHELDRSFADQLFSAQRQARVIKTLLEHQENNQASLAAVEKIHAQLTAIEEKYSKNSPSLLFLGPIGTTSIVLKEQQLATKLFEVVNSLGTLAHSLMPEGTQLQQSASLEAALQRNQGYISTLLKTGNNG